MLNDSIRNYERATGAMEACDKISTAVAELVETRVIAPVVVPQLFACVHDVRRPYYTNWKQAIDDIATDVITAGVRT